jgi:hypothetical protein
VSKRDDSGQLWGEPAPESLADVLASIRALVSAETSARIDGAAGPAGDVILLTREMRVDVERADVHAGEILADGLDEVRPRAAPAPLFDEAALRDMINAIVRDELQGELGERINRNLRKLIRREIGQILDEAAPRKE